ncbi:MAG: hypothetical protein GY941_11225 [Planctomycetes bacterium]|nr:hypothetical protein [Planctomycetota bacterium]
MEKLKEKKQLVIKENGLPVIIKFITRINKEKFYILKSPSKGEKLLLNKLD